jgi:hypothetical protein
MAGNVGGYLGGGGAGGGGSTTIIASGVLTSGAVVSGYIGNAAVVSGSFASGQITAKFAFASGAITSGVYIGSGTIMGSLGGGPFNIASGNIGPNEMGSGSILSGAIASGQVGPNHLASGIITSGNFIGSGTILGQVGGGPFMIASGTIGQKNLSSGIITSGNYIGSGTITGQAGGGVFMIASGTIGQNDLASGVGGSSLQSGTVQSGNIGNAAVVSGSIASGQISAKFAFASGAITSGVYIGSGTIMGQAGGGPFMIASGSIGLNDLASGVAGGTVTLTSGNVQSGNIGNAAVTSGNIASGQIGTYHFASGTIAPFAAGTLQAVSGLGAGFITQEAISGVRAISITQSGHLQIAMASISGRMPAVGVVVDNVASGIQVNVYSFGQFQFTSGMADYSGYVGQQLFVGRSGQIVSVSGSWNSGGLLSGDVTQPVGMSYNSGAVSFGVAAALPTVIGFITSGDIGANAVISGNIASGTITGQAAGGVFMIASGSIGTNDLASGVGGGVPASGSLTTYQFVSGAVAPDAQGVTPYVSGSPRSVAVLTGETISGIRAVSINQSGALQVAMASVSGRMPSVGVVVDNVLSGIQVNVYTAGYFLPSSGLNQFSGYEGQNLYVGRSGQLVTVSGSWNSGGLLSGDWVQSIGWAFNGSGGVFQVGVGAALSGSTLPLWFSGNISSGQIGQKHLASGVLTSGVYIGSGTIMGQAGGGPFMIASGTIGANDLAAGVAGSIQSGGLTTYLVASGAIMPDAQYVLAYTSGAPRNPGTALTGETISGIRAVSITQSGTLQVAMASQSGRMPAVGVVVDNVASGIQVNVYTAGWFAPTSGLNQFSGYEGQQLYVGRSGQLVTVSGSWNSGGLLSGDQIQAIGFAFNGSGGQFQVGVGAALPFVASLIYSGHIASGQIGQAALASGAVQSGQIASGTPVNFARTDFSDFFLAGQAISGVIAVAIGSGGAYVVPAERQSGFRLPAIGVNLTNAVSGSAIQIISWGLLATPNSGTVASGGWILGNQYLYLGSGGLLVNLSGFNAGPSSGPGPNPSLAAISGCMVQRIAIAMSGQIFIQPDVTPTSGLLTGVNAQVF